MTEMIERVARAMCMATMNAPDDQYAPGFKERFTDKNWVLFGDSARTAIEAVRRTYTPAGGASIEGNP